MGIERTSLFGLTFVLLAAFALLGCAAIDRPPSADDQGVPPGEDAETTFRAAYGLVSDRYLQPVSAEQVAVDGLRGLSDIDPTLAVGRMGDLVMVSAGGRTIGTLPTPKARDVPGWAELTVRVWRLARGASPAIAETSWEALYEAMFDRAMANLDPHARYATAAEAERNRRRRDGYYGAGVGIGLVEHRPTVVEVTGGGPAERAGVRVGDVPLSLDGQLLAGLAAEEVARRLQGDAPSWVRLTVLRPGRGQLHFALLRTYVIADTVEQRYDDGILYLRVRHFNQGTAGRLRDTLTEMASGLRGQLQGVLLDLRGSPGGLLQQAVKVADLFLSGGAILATRGRHPDSMQTHVAGGDDVIEGLPLVILIDGDTASAAELVAAALQERHRAVVVGSSSYGKGAVQTVVPLPNGGELSFPWSTVTTPSGRELASGGVRPAICSSGAYVADPETIEQLLRPAGRAELPAEVLGCPAEARDGGLVDWEVARRLIQDRALYAAALQPNLLVAGGPRHGAP